MFRKLTYILILSFWAMISYAQTENSYLGNEFWFGFMHNLDDDDSDIIKVYITGDKFTFGKLELPHQNYEVSFYVHPDTVRVLELPRLLVENQLNEAVNNLGIYIATQDDVSVDIWSYQFESSAKTAVLPVRNLGTSYMINAYSGIPSTTLKSELLVVASEDDTEIEIIPSETTLMGKPALIPFTVVLDRGETYLMKATSDKDLTGTIVRTTAASGSCKPISVFAGSQCANVSTGCIPCDHIFKQSIPDNLWDKEYVTNSFNGLNYDLRITALNDGTTFNINGGGPTGLNRGEFAHLSGINGLTYVMADQPVKVIQYMRGKNCAGTGDPSMLYLNGISHMASKYDFLVENSSLVLDHYLNIFVPLSFADQVYLDGSLLKEDLFSIVPYNNDLVYARIKVSAGKHSLSCIGGLNAYLYGYGDSESYAYSVGGNFEYKNIIDEVCDNKGMKLGAPGSLTNNVWMYGMEEDTLMVGDTLNLSPVFSSGMYKVEGENINSGCKEAAWYQVSYDTTLNVSLISSDSSVCRGEEVRIAAVVSPEGEYSYDWSIPGAKDANFLTFSAGFSDTITCQVFSQNSCSAGVGKFYLEVQNTSLGKYSLKRTYEACQGDSVQIEGEVCENIDYIDFDSNGALGTVLGGSNQSYFGGNSGNALVFDEDFTREATSATYDLQMGGELSFFLRAFDKEGLIDSPENGEEIVLQYSKSGGPWTFLKVFYPPFYPEYKQVVIEITDSLKSSSLAFRWYQKSHSGPGNDVWALEDVSVCSATLSNISVQWAPKTYFSNDTIIAPRVLASADTQLHVTVSSPDGCLIRDTLMIEVDSAFGLTITPDTALCDVQGIQIEVTPSRPGDYTYIWQPFDQVSNPAVANPVATPIRPENFTVSVSSGNGCVDSASVFIDVSQLTYLTISASDTAICVGDTIDFTSSIQGTFLEDDFDPLINLNSWDTIAGGSLSNNCGSVSGNALYFNSDNDRYAETIDLNTSGGGYVTFYLMLATGLNPCEDVDPGEEVVLEYSTDTGATFIEIQTFAENAYPFFTYVSIPIPAGAQTVSTRFRWRQKSWNSEGFDNWALDGVNIISGGQESEYDYQWTPSAYVLNDTLPDTKAFPDKRMVFELSITDSLGCKVTRNQEVLAGAHFAVSVSPDTTTCRADGINLEAISSWGGVESFNWSPGIYLDDSTSSNPTAYPTGTTTFEVEVVSDSGCTEADSVTIFMPMPINVVNSLTDTSICLGDSILVSLSFQETIIDSFHNYQINEQAWENIYGADASGACGDTSDGGALYFDGDSVRIAQTSYINTVPGGSISFFIKFGDDSLCNSPESNEDVVLEYSRDNGNTWNQMAYIQEHLYPIFTKLTYAIPLAARGAQVSFRWRQVSFNVGGIDNWSLDDVNIISGNEVDEFNYHWSSSPTSYISDTLGNEAFLKPLSKTAYRIEIKDTASVCTIYEEFDLAVGQNYNTYTSDTVKKCYSGPLELIVSNDHTGSTSIEWSPSELFSDPYKDTTYVNPDTSLFVQVRTYSDEGCEKIDTVYLEVYPPFLLDLSANDTGLCNGDTMMLVPTISGGLGGNVFLWSPSGSLDSSSMQITKAFPVTNTTYSLEVTDTISECKVSDSIEVDVGAPFNLVLSSSGDTIICTGDTVTLEATTDYSGNIAYYWDPEEVLIDSVGASVEGVISDTTVFRVKAISDSGCIRRDSIEIKVVGEKNLHVYRIGEEKSICFGESVKLIADRDYENCSQYRVDTIPYNLIGGIDSTFLLGNDQVSSAIALPFNFRFFCNYYNKIYVSSNGFITFSDEQFHGCCEGKVIPSAAEPNNMIAASWSDLNPLQGGEIRLFTTGTAPNRIFSVMFREVPHDNNGPRVYTQIQLHESGYEVQVHINFMDSDGSKHTLGIENLDGTIAYYPADKNGVDWNGFNEAYAFVPDYNPVDLQFTWSPSYVFSNERENLSEVRPPYSGNYFAIGLDTISGCSYSGDFYLKVDTTFEIDAIEDTFLCDLSGFQLGLTSIDSSLSFAWSPDSLLQDPNRPDPVVDTAVDSVKFFVYATASDGCMSADSVILRKFDTINLTTIENQVICLGDSMQLWANGGTVYYWTPDTLMIGGSTSTPTVFPVTSTMYTVTSFDAGGCPHSKEVFVQVEEKDTLIIPSDTFVCQVIDFYIDPGFYSTYLWQDSSEFRVFNVQDTGLYWVEVSNVCGVYRDSMQVIDYYEPVLFDLGKDTFSCSNDSLILGLDVPEAEEYYWLPGGIKSQYIVADREAPYVLRITDQKGCYSYDTIEVNQFDSPDINIDSVTGCVGDTVVLRASGIEQVGWYPDTLVFEDSLYVLKDTNQVVGLGVDSNGCTDLDSAVVMLIGLPQNFLPDTLLQVCYEDELKLSSLNSFLSFRWSNGDTSVYPKFSEEGIVYLTVENRCGFGTDTMEIEFHPYILPLVDSNIYLCNEDSIMVVLQNYDDYDYVVWWNDTSGIISQDEREVLLSEGSYTVYGLEDDYKCYTPTHFEVLYGDGEITVPNVFTPNGDGSNDDFRLLGYSCIRDFRMVIMNRWGKKVYDSDDLDFIWDGGTNVSGTYFYQVLYTNESGEEKNIKGWVELIR